MTNEVLRAIRMRRVVRRMTEEPIDREQLIAILEAARWAQAAAIADSTALWPSSDPSRCGCCAWCRQG